MKNFINKFYIIVFVASASCAVVFTESEKDLYKKNENGRIAVKLSAVRGKSLKEPGADAESLRMLIEEILNGILKEDSRMLLEAVDPELGVYVDYDAPRTSEVFKNELNNPDTFTYALLFDSAKLRKITKDANQRSIRSILLKNKSVSIEVFLEGEGERSEVRLLLDDTPEENFRFNNPVFLYRGGRWRIWQMF